MHPVSRGLAVSARVAGAVAAAAGIGAVTAGVVAAGVVARHTGPAKGPAMAAGVILAAGGAAAAGLGLSAALLGATGPRASRRLVWSAAALGVAALPGGLSAVLTLAGGGPLADRILLVLLAPALAAVALVTFLLVARRRLGGHDDAGGTRWVGAGAALLLLAAWGVLVVRGHTGPGRAEAAKQSARAGTISVEQLGRVVADGPHWSLEAAVALRPGLLRLTKGWPRWAAPALPFGHSWGEGLTNALRRAGPEGHAVLLNLAARPPATGQAAALGALQLELKASLDEQRRETALLRSVLQMLEEGGVPARRAMLRALAEGIPMYGGAVAALPARDRDRLQLLVHRQLEALPPADAALVKRVLERSGTPAQPATEVPAAPSSEQAPGAQHVAVVGHAAAFAAGRVAVARGEQCFILDPTTPDRVVGIALGGTAGALTAHGMEVYVVVTRAAAEPNAAAETELVGVRAGETPAIVSRCSFHPRWTPVAVGPGRVAVLGGRLALIAAKDGGRIATANLTTRRTFGAPGAPATMYLAGDRLVVYHPKSGSLSLFDTTQLERIKEIYLASGAGSITGNEHTVLISRPGTGGRTGSTSVLEVARASRTAAAGKLLAPQARDASGVGYALERTATGWELHQLEPTLQSVGVTSLPGLPGAEDLVLLGITPAHVVAFRPDDGVYIAARPKPK